MTRFFIGLIISVFAVYGLWEAYPLIAGPALTIVEPVSGAHYLDGIVAITGQARRVTALTLDGGPLFAEQSGRFTTTLAFPRGGSILTLTATDRFGRSVTKQRYIYVP